MYFFGIFVRDFNLANFDLLKFEFLRKYDYSLQNLSKWNSYKNYG